MDKLKYYLGTGLKCTTTFQGMPLKKILDVYLMLNIQSRDTEYKPNMRPLSSLTPHVIEEMKSDLLMIWCDYYDEWVNHFYDLGKFVNFKQAPFEIVEWLISKHYWIGDQTLFGKSLIQIED